MQNVSEELTLLLPECVTVARSSTGICSWKTFIFLHFPSVKLIKVHCKEGDFYSLTSATVGKPPQGISVPFKRATGGVWLETGMSRA